MDWDEMTSEERLQARPDLAECSDCGGLGGEHLDGCDDDDAYPDDDDADEAF